MRVAWIYPLFEDKVPQLTQNRFFKWTRSCDVLIYPIIPASACTIMKSEGFEVFFIDAVAMHISRNEFFKKLERIRPDLVFMEAKTPVVKHIWRTAEEIKSIIPETRIAICGDHVSVLPEESLRKCDAADYVVTGGDFDIGALKLAKAIQNGTNLPAGVWYRRAGSITSTGPFELVEDLDSLPYIDRDLVPWHLYHESWRLYDEFFYIMSGRGCYAKCTFCSWPAMLFNHKYRLRSPENVVGEIKYLTDKYGAKEIFDDLDTWPARSRWAEKFCRLMIEEGLNEEVVWSINARADDLQDLERLKLMKKAGCRVLKIGVESASQETLSRIRKQITVEQIRNAVNLCRKAGLTIHLTAMFGYPWETREDALKTIKFVESLKPDSAQFSIITPYPGTELYREALENDWFRVDPEDWDRFDMSWPVLKSGDMMPGEVVDLCVKAWRNMYLNPAYIIRMLWRIKSWRQLKLLLRGVRAVVRTHIGGLKND
jgi:radical SAM superfamily enzyme YgiQ (UPF0313 family)